MAAKKRVRRKRSAWSRAAAQMAPSKVLTRFFTGGQYNSPKAVRKAMVRAAVKKLSTREVSRQTPEAYERLMGQAAPAAKKAPAKKAAAPRGKSSVYEDAKLIPGQNRAAAARVAKKATAGRPRASEPTRGEGGKFNGRTPGNGVVHQPALGQAPPADLRPRRLFGG